MEFAAHSFAELDQVFLPDRITIAQSSHIAPEGDTGSVGQNFIELGRDIRVRNTRRNPKRQLWTTDERRFLCNRFAVINESVFADTEGTPLIDSCGLFVVNVIDVFATMSI